MGQAPRDTIFFSIHQILMLSLLSWGEYWLVPLLRSPESQRSLTGERYRVQATLPPSHFSEKDPHLATRSLHPSVSLQKHRFHPPAPLHYPSVQERLSVPPPAQRPPPFHAPRPPKPRHTSLRLLFFLPLFSPEELSSLDTNSLLLKLSLSCLDEDFDDEPREGVDFFSIFTLTFFFFLDLSLGEQEGRGCWALGFPASSGPNLSWLSQGLSQSQPHCPAHAKRTQPGVSALSAPGELIITESQEGSGATA